MKESSKPHTLSLYQHFKPGDRVKRIYQGGKGRNQTIEGIILAMDHHQLEIVWHKIDGTYCSHFDLSDFTICDFEEVMYGNSKYSPIKQKKI